MIILCGLPVAVSVVPEAELPARRGPGISVSRSHGLGACARLRPPAAGRRVGVDLECAREFLDSGTDVAAFADLILGDRELIAFERGLGAGRGDRRGALADLLRVWVRKEAVLKALGTGLDTARGGVELRSVEVSPPWDAAACLTDERIALADVSAAGLRAVGAGAGRGDDDLVLAVALV